MKLMKVLFMWLMVWSGIANAAFTLNGTRYIYTEGDNEISVLINNTKESRWGGQSWVENGSEINSESTYFIPFPSLFIIEGKNSQIVRVAKMETLQLSEDKESLFWLNVQEIPPKLNDGGSSLAIAINTKVKLIYRSKKIASKRKKAEMNIVIKEEDGFNYLINPTPYYFSIAEINVGGKMVVKNARLNQELSEFKPFSKILLPETINLVGEVVIGAINDYGGVNKYEVNKS